MADRLLDALCQQHLRTHFDLLVTDHLMPGMIGTDPIQTFRSHRPHTPALLVSGYAEEASIEPGIPCLTKPFRKDELASCLSSPV